MNNLEGTVSAHINTGTTSGYIYTPVTQEAKDNAQDALDNALKQLVFLFPTYSDWNDPRLRELEDALLHFRSLKRIVTAVPLG